MKRVLMVQPSINPPGGGNGVAVWMIEALKSDHRVTLLTWEPPRLDAINRFYGTSLRPSDFELTLIPRLVRAIARRTPTPMALVKDNYLLLRCRRMAARFDVVISANNEMDVGRHGIQYIHYPKLSLRPEVDLRWFHRIPFVVDAYRWFGFRLTGFSMERMRRNIFIVNSDFIGALVRALYGVETVTLYPPITGTLPAVPWEHREDGFVCIGRISPEKRIEQIIDILSKVRGNGLAPHLHIVGTPGDDAYVAFIRDCVDANRSWVTMHENLPREELAQLVASHRYGIHAMNEEHFGMAVAEMVRAGCIVFAPNNGGPAQILGEDDRLLYSSVQDAAEKIGFTMLRRERQKELRDFLGQRGALFSAQRFVHEFRDLVERFEPV
ncbi:MAG TPA: glycosyltransferase family 4 protein [Candidatus Binataceae bacterium]|jgi:glycosyltransferase involved in cell wall biosynthesis|nr:glycosyltransferase family 4 protein [Candidatus Binataceae bacterium]